MGSGRVEPNIVSSPSFSLCRSHTSLLLLAAPEAVVSRAGLLPARSGLPGEPAWGGRRWALPATLPWVSLRGACGFGRGKPEEEGSCAGWWLRGAFCQVKGCCCSWGLPLVRLGSVWGEVKCWGFLQRAGRGFFQQRSASLAGRCLQHPSLRGRTVVQQHHSGAGSDFWKWRGIWQDGQGLWFRGGGSSSGSRLPPGALSQHCPEDGEGRSGGMQLQRLGAAVTGQS